jgi:hypothetical protein
LRVARISIWFTAHLPSQSSATAASQLGTGCFLPVEVAQPRPLDVDLASMEGDLAVGFPPAVRLPPATSL